MTNYDVEQLLKNKGIGRSQGKIKSAISNAQSFLNIQKEVGSFSDFMWSYNNGSPIQNGFSCSSELPQTTALAKQMK